MPGSQAKAIARPRECATTPRRATTQTIDEIETRAAAVADAERRALRELAAFLRDRAVELPVESNLPLRFAKSAKTLDQFGRPLTGGPLDQARFDAPTGFDCALNPLERECAAEQELAAAAATVRALEMFPASSGSTLRAERLRALIPVVRQAYDLGEA